MASFPHRMNRNGTVDSICPCCYITVGTSTNEADLQRMETTHVCESGRLRYFEEQREFAKRLPRNESSQQVVPIKAQAKRVGRHLARKYD